jgi:hypothetical protein
MHKKNTNKAVSAASSKAPVFRRALFVGRKRERFLLRKTLSAKNPEKFQEKCYPQMIAGCTMPYL